MRVNIRDYNANVIESNSCLLDFTNKKGGFMMKLKKTLWITLKILIVTILIFVVYLFIIKSNNDYERINQETKEKITSIINKCKGEFPNLQTENIRARWNDEAFNQQKEMMDKVLDTLTIIGESEKGLPSQYIIATYYDEMKVYIAYNEKTPNKNIIIEISGHYYGATANEKAISAIVDYIKQQFFL